jgi:uncharacterized protein (TIGR02145 family)
MRKLLMLLMVISITFCVFAQPPQKMSYQAVIRNSSGQLITNQAIGMRISILQGSVNGTAVYTETQTTTINANGLVTIEIGGGTIVTGTFAGIDWSNGTYFIKTETDPNGGTSYTITGTSQILSVPYALYSKTAGNGSLWSQSGSNIYYSSGKVGIGVSDPTYNLDVRGSNSDDDGVIQLGNSDLSHRMILFGGRQSDPNPFISWKQGDPLRFATDEGGWSEKMRITANGLVGIGTVAPTSELDVSGIITATGGSFTNDLLVNGLTLGKGNSSVSSNTAIGASALPQNTTGNSNTAIGSVALYANTTGSSNTATGFLALQLNTTGSANTATGNAALSSNTEGYANTAYGHMSLYVNKTGIHNTAIGYLALSNAKGHYNAANGSAALYSNTTGSYNTADGYQAGYNNANGNRNVFLGSSAGYYETGSNKLFIDNQSRADESDGRTKALIYGIFDADPANQVLTINGNVNVNNNKITNVADPSSAQDAATKAYVDAILSKLSATGAILADADGNIYSTVRLGSQVWMGENLKTTKYKDGTAIPLVTDNTAWSNLTTSGYCWYSNNSANKDTYGALYNWYTINTGELCPTGWHVPTTAEWTKLENYLIASGYNYDGTTTGNKIAKSLASTALWTSSDNTGAVGNADYPAKKNLTGFTALPGGIRVIDGPFSYIGLVGYWWSATVYDEPDAWYRDLSFNSSFVSSDGANMKNGFSVRCLRD